MTAPDPRVGEPRDLIAFAKECADPDWSLSIPPIAKGVITDLLAELADRDEKLAKVEALHTRAFKPVETWAKGYRFTGEHCAFDGAHWPCATIAAVAAANGGGSGRECDYCAAPEFQKHKGFCLTIIEGAREQWRESL